jgi:hypothetical protein
VERCLTDKRQDKQRERNSSQTSPCGEQNIVVYPKKKKKNLMKNEVNVEDVITVTAHDARLSN